MLAISGFVFLLLAAYLLLLIAQNFSAKKPKQGLKIDPAAWLILLVAVWLFIQALVKFPLDTLSQLSPITAQLYTGAFQTLQLTNIPTAVPISLEPSATLDRAMLSLACFCVLVLMGQLINSRKRLTIFCYTIVLSGTFQAIFGVMMTVTGVEYLFFTPKETYLHHATGTFVNRNHFAGYLEMALAVGIGLLLSIKTKTETTATNWRDTIRYASEILLSQIAIVRCMLIIMVVGLIMSHSRMGNAAFFNALLITGGLAIAASKKFRTTGFYVILVSIVLLDILILGSVFDLDKLAERIEQTGMNTETRDEVVEYGLKMIPDFWLTGSGAGTFAYIFPKYVEQFFGVLYDFAHNDYLQIFLEFGVVGFVPLVMYPILRLVQGWNRLNSDQSSLSRGMGFTAIMVGLSLGIHSAVDFNLQISANVLLFVSVLCLPWLAGNIRESRNR